MIFKASTTSDHAFASTLPKNKEFVFTVASKGKGAIASGEFKRWNDVPFDIPPLPPSGLPGCKAVDIQYRLEVRIHEVILSETEGNMEKKTKQINQQC